jgi:hypothetical protein
MTNNSGQAAALSGWVLRAPRHGVSFNFPSVSLESGATFYVVSGTRPTTVEEHDQVAHWPVQVEWDTSVEDTAELVAPSGNVVASVVVAPPTAVDGMEIDQSTGGHGKANNSNQCAIM